MHLICPPYGMVGGILWISEHWNDVKYTCFESYWKKKKKHLQNFNMGEYGEYGK